MRDQSSTLGTIETLIGLGAQKNSVTSQSLALIGYNACTFYINAGTYTDGTHTLVIQESPDNATWNQVANIDLVAWQATSPTNFAPQKNGNAQPLPISGASSAVNQRVAYIGGQPYVRVVDTVTGAPATGCVYGVVAVLGDPLIRPAAV